LKKFYFWVFQITQPCWVLKVPNYNKSMEISPQYHPIRPPRYMMDFGLEI
jgi:hypothetical protein